MKLKGFDIIKLLLEARKLCGTDRKEEEEDWECTTPFFLICKHKCSFCIFIQMMQMVIFYRLCWSTLMKKIILFHSSTRGKLEEEFFFLSSWSISTSAITAVIQLNLIRAYSLICVIIYSLKVKSKYTVKTTQWFILFIITHFFRIKNYYKFVHIISVCMALSPLEISLQVVFLSTQVFVTRVLEYM